VSIITSLLKNCNTANKERVIGKFVENDHEKVRGEILNNIFYRSLIIFEKNNNLIKKVDRLLELYFKYCEQVDQVDLDDVDEEDEDRGEEIYLRKLENGLFALQSIVYIIMDISVNGPPSVEQKQA
jgi:hypothetical protein